MILQERETLAMYYVSTKYTVFLPGSTGQMTHYDLTTNVMYCYLYFMILQERETLAMYYVSTKYTVFLPGSKGQITHYDLTTNVIIIKG